MGLTSFQRSRRIAAYKEQICDLKGLKTEEERQKYKELHLIGLPEDQLKRLVEELQAKKTKKAENKVEAPAAKEDEPALVSVSSKPTRRTKRTKK